MSKRISADVRVYRRPVTILSTKLTTVIPMKSATIRKRMCGSCPRNARSIRSFERYGSTNDRPVLSRLSKSTSSRRRQYGIASSRSVSLLAGHDIKSRRHVRVQRNCTEVLERGGFVQIDSVASLINVQHFAVGAGLQGHARPPLELGFAVELVIRKVER